MGFTATTTTTSSNNLTVDRLAASSPARSRPILTGASRSAPGPPVAAPAATEQAPERPSKRARLEPKENATDDGSRLRQCVERHLFPHIDAPLSTLPKDEVDTDRLGRRVLLNLAESFLNEYGCRNGTVSARFEAELAARARAQVYALRHHPEFQLPRRHSKSSDRSSQPLAETPVPVPQPLVHTLPPDQKRAVPAPSTTAPSYSSSPVPVPPIPHRSPVEALGTANGTAPAVQSSPVVVKEEKKPARPQPEVIVIDDDDETPQEKPAEAGKPAATKPPEPSRKAPSAVPSAASPVVNGQSRETTVQDFRKRAHALVWRTTDGTGSVPKTSSRERLPYITAEERELVLSGSRKPLQLSSQSLRQPSTLHVDFRPEDFEYLATRTRKILGLSTERKTKDAKLDLSRVLRRNPSHVPRVVEAFAREKRLPGRTKVDIDNLFRDLINRTTRSSAVRLTIERENPGRRADLARSGRVSSLLLAREVAGQRGWASMRRLENFNNEFRKCREDALDVRAEWAGCAGDIATITWVSPDSFICGTTEHSDAHNQQYNKPGNLVFGSCSLGTLHAYPDHRIVRPVVEKGENSTDAMRQSQDPWLYSSVVSSDYDPTRNWAFTSGFDRTVKIWRVEKSGASMSLLGEWKHGGNVNFVAASKHDSGMVATAADVAVDAVRVYNIDETDISGSPFRPYSCSRVTDAEGNTVPTDKWAYYPATMQWGLAEGVRHLLLVGYSPRTRTGDDNDIPEDRRDSGELCLWDGLTGERWRVTSATTQNVFEVLWHPTQPSFIAATSPLGLDLEPSIRTQIRIFRPANRDEFGVKAFSPIKTLDCTAIDINELTMMPNSTMSCYVTAGCTDGCVYVWDTAVSDNKPIHVLRHGEPIDEYRGDREREDVGVKFTAWGTSLDRFYTGSSDGIVKVWNVRSRGKPPSRKIFEAPAPITAGMFSADKSKLIVGDASGRVFFLSVDEEEQKPGSFLQVRLPDSAELKTIRRPIPVILHPEPPPPSHDAEGRPIVAETGASRGRAYLANLHLRRHPNPTIGVVQGPRYAETGLFRREAHFLEDPAQPLLARWEVMQQEAVKEFSGGRRRDQFMALRPVKEVVGLETLHARNRAKGLEVEELPEETRLALEREGVDFGLMEEYVVEYEEMPRVEEEE